MVGELIDTPWSGIYALYATGVVLVILSVTFIVIKSRCEFEEESYAARALRICAGMSGMGFGWCCLFGSRTLSLQCSVFDANGISMQTISGRVLLALALSLIS